jgi:hypothetical protein
MQDYRRPAYYIYFLYHYHTKWLQEMQPVEQSADLNTYLQLLQLREKLSVFEAVPCRLMHEQVEELFEESIGTDADPDPEQLRVRRSGFCKPAMRRHRLGCAHTSANGTFARLADRVYETGLLNTAFRPSATIEELILKIYLMDHEKGSIEKQKALAQYGDDATKIAEIDIALEEVISRHEATINELEQLRRELMLQLDTAIERYR